MKWADGRQTKLPSIKAATTVDESVSSDKKYSAKPARTRELATHQVLHFMKDHGIFIENPERNPVSVVVPLCDASEGSKGFFDYPGRVISREVDVHCGSPNRWNSRF